MFISSIWLHEHMITWFPSAWIVYLNKSRFWLSNLFILSVLDKCYSSNASYAYNIWNLRFYYSIWWFVSWTNTFAWTICDWSCKSSYVDCDWHATSYLHSWGLYEQWVSKTVARRLSAKNPTFWAQKNPRLSAFYLSYLPEKKN